MPFKGKLSFFLIGALIAVFIAAIFSLFFGSTTISIPTVLQALFQYDPTNQQQIMIQELRLPRTLGDILVGASFATAGALMQGLTRNPLADSGLLGINAGASFGLALVLAFGTNIAFGFTIIASFIGAALSMLLVFGLLIMKHRNLDSVRLVLAGLAVSLFLTALTQGLSIVTQTGQDLTFWSAGGVAGIRMNQIQIAGPILILALVLALFLARKVSILSLGDETAQGLGIDLNRTKFVCLIDVLFLAGTSVALAGPIAFVGLLVPHIVRFFVGARYEAILPASILTGSLFMLVADLLSRLINPPSETPIGLIFAIIGVPVFILIANRQEVDHD